MARDYTESELEAYLDEGLSPADMAAIEESLRGDTELSARLSSINARRDAGMHSLGDIWRRHRISCPSREQLGSYLLEALEKEQLDYVRFHLETIGCRICLASYEDMKRRQEETTAATVTRRRKYFQSSAGYLKGEEKK